MKTGSRILAVVMGIFLAAAAYGQFAMPKLKTYRVSKKEIASMAAARAIIETKFGTITLKFFPDVAPQHVKNFIELAKNGFYNGTTFHRVIRGFMIQGGDPNGNGTGGPGYTIKAEFNKRPHKRGTLSMARTNMPDTAGSQFFICFDMAPRQKAMLDGNYTVFGEVVSGMEVADKIVALQVPGTDRPRERVEVKISIKEGRKK